MDKFALSFHIRMITVQYTGQKSKILVSPLESENQCIYQLCFPCTLVTLNWFVHKSDQNDKQGFLGKDLGISQSAQLLCKFPFSFKWFDVAWWSIFFMEICFGSSLLWKKSTHLTFWWVWGRRRRRPWWWRRWPGWWRRRWGRSRRPARRRSPLKARQLAPAKPFLHQL